MGDVVGVGPERQCGCVHVPTLPPHGTAGVALPWWNRELAGRWPGVAGKFARVEERVAQDGIERATSDQADVLLGLIQRSIAACAPYDARQRSVWASSFTRESVTAMVADTVVLTAPGGVANLVILTPGTGLLDHLYVDPDHQRSGLGCRLVEAIEAEARQRGVGTLRVDASLALAPLLERLGYSVVEVYEKTVGGVTFTNTWLERSLHPES